MATRREVLAAITATVTLPMLNSALRSVRAAASAPATGPAAFPANAAAPAEKAGWFATTLKVTDTKDGEVTAVPGHTIGLVRNGKEINALSLRCSHRGAYLPPKAGEKILTCPWHGSQFNKDGTVAKAPATAALPFFAIRVNKDGFIEIDPGTTAKKEDKEYKIEA